MTSPKTILARILFFLYLAAIALLCFMHADKFPDVQKTILAIPTDKVVHFIMFFPFPILAFLSYDHMTKKLGPAIIFSALTLVCGLLIAYGTELIQRILPTRAMDINDFIADALAISISCAIVFIVDVTNLKARNR